MASDSNPQTNQTRRGAYDHLPRIVVDDPSQLEAMVAHTEGDSGAATDTASGRRLAWEAPDEYELGNRRNTENDDMDAARALNTEQLDEMMSEGSQAARAYREQHPNLRYDADAVRALIMSGFEGKNNSFAPASARMPTEEYGTAENGSGVGDRSARFSDFNSGLASQMHGSMNAEVDEQEMSRQHGV